MGRRNTQTRKTLAIIALAGAWIGCDPMPRIGDRISYSPLEYFIDIDNDGDVDVIVRKSGSVIPNHFILYYDSSMTAQLIISGYDTHSPGQKIMTPKIKESATRAFNGLKDFYHIVDSTKK